MLSIAMSILISCASNSDKDKHEAIMQFDKWRTRIFLNSVNDNLVLDSALFFDQHRAVCDFCGGVKTFDDKFGDTYRIREFYSSQDSALKNFRKEIIWDVDSGNYVLVVEQDIYKKFDPSGFDIELHIAIGPLSGYEGMYRTFLEVDSIPTKESLRLAEIKAGIEPKEGYYICGTAYNEFLAEYFPERHVALDTNNIIDYIRQFKP
jgi:hypothetical protein